MRQFYATHLANSNNNDHAAAVIIIRVCNLCLILSFFGRNMRYESET
jgi:hypothetical protein